MFAVPPKREGSRVLKIDIHSAETTLASLSLDTTKTLCQYSGYVLRVGGQRFSPVETISAGIIGSLPSFTKGDQKEVLSLIVSFRYNTVHCRKSADTLLATFSQKLPSHTWQQTGVDVVETTPRVQIRNHSGKGKQGGSGGDTGFGGHAANFRCK